MSSTAAPGADQPLDADRRGLAEAHRDAEVGGQRRLDDLLLHLAVERHAAARSARRPGAGRSAGPARRAGRARRAARGRRSRGRARRRSPASAARTCARRGRPPVRRTVADPDAGEARGACRSGRPPPPGARRSPPCSKTPIAGDLASSSAPTASRSRTRTVPDEHPDVRDLLAGRPALDLEHAAGRRRPSRSPSARRQQVGDPGHERVDPGAGDAPSRRTPGGAAPPGVRSARPAAGLVERPRLERGGA